MANNQELEIVLSYMQELLQEVADRTTEHADVEKPKGEHADVKRMLVEKNAKIPDESKHYEFVRMHGKLVLARRGGKKRPTVFVQTSNGKLAWSRVHKASVDGKKVTTRRK